MAIYGKTDYDISSPVGKKVVEKLDDRAGGSLPIRHNVHSKLNSGNGTITGPDTKKIVPDGCCKGGGFKDLKGT